MHGSWISREQQTQIRNLNNGKIVHIIFDDNYTVMVKKNIIGELFNNLIQIIGIVIVIQVVVNIY